MELQAYLDRIGYTAGPELTPENLHKLIRCHLETVPFENLDIAFNPHPLSAKYEDMYHKVVDRKRGGICFELNSIFCWLMAEMGYDVYPVHVRLLMRFPDPRNAPVTHRGNVCILDGKKYYCDVGFGGPGPKGLICVDDPEVQWVAGEPFIVEKKDPYVTISRKGEDDKWVPVIHYADLPVASGDFDFLLFAFSADPNGGFVTRRTVNLCRPDGDYLALTNMEYSKKENGVTVKRELQTEEEMWEVLREFGIEKD